MVRASHGTDTTPRRLPPTHVEWRDWYWEVTEVVDGDVGRRSESVTGHGVTRTGTGQKRHLLSRPSGTRSELTTSPRVGRERAWFKLKLRITQTSPRPTRATAVRNGRPTKGRPGGSCVAGLGPLGTRGNSHRPRDSLTFYSLV